MTAFIHYQDVNSLSVEPYSLGERFAETLRRIYQRYCEWDPNELYQIGIGDELSPERVGAIFDEKRSHPPNESYHSFANPAKSLPVAAKECITDGWS